MRRKLLIKISLALISTILLGGCSTVQKKKGYEIPIKLKEEIWKLQSDLGVSLIKRDYETTLRTFNDSVVKNLNSLNIDSVVQGIRYYLLEYPYCTQDIYYQKSYFGVSNVNFLFEDEDFNPFYIKYKANNKETAVTTALLGNCNIQYCLTTIYSKYDNGWKVDFITVGLYMIEGKDAIDWVAEAEKYVLLNDYALGMYSLSIAKWLIKPAQGFWEFQNEKEVLSKISNLEKKIRRNVKLDDYTKSLKSKPKIKDLYVVIKDKKLYPGLTYETNLMLNDSIAINKECSELNTAFVELYNNLCDSICVRIIPKTEAWSEPDTFLVQIRQLEK